MKQSTKPALRAHLLALFTVAIWGITFISTKVLLDYFSAAEIMFIRFLLGWLALWGWCLGRRLSRPKTEISRVAWKSAAFWRRELLLAGAGLTGVTLYFLFENLSLNYTYASNASMIVSASPVFVALFAHFFTRGEKVGPAFFAGFAAAMLGIGLIGYSGNTMLRLNPLGDILALLAAVMWGLYAVFIKKISPYGLEVVTVTRKTFFYGLLFLLPALWITGFSYDIHTLTAALADRAVWMSVLFNLLFLGLAASALCYATWTYAVEKLGATRSSAYIYLIPPGDHGGFGIDT